MPITINDCKCGETPVIKIFEDDDDEFALYIECLPCGEESLASYSADKAIEYWNADNPRREDARKGS